MSCRFQAAANFSISAIVAVSVISDLLHVVPLPAAAQYRTGKLLTGLYCPARDDPRKLHGQALIIAGGSGPQYHCLSPIPFPSFLP
jgi:hypothetical protein